MPLSLLNRGLFPGTRKRVLKFTATPKKSYDVIIIGGGGHGLATAYYLAKTHGIRRVAVFEKSWLAAGNTARNTTIVRSNYLTGEGVHFYEASRKLFAGLSNELGMNIMYTERGHLTLVHSDSSLDTARWRAESNRHFDIDSEIVERAELQKLCPLLNLSEDVPYPVLGALYHPPGAITRHDAVAWGYAARAAELGVEILQQSEVTGIRIENDRVVGVETAHGVTIADKVLQAVAGSSTQVANLAGINLPIQTVPLQACVSEPVKPFLDPIVVSSSLHAYVSQSSRGELVMGGATDQYSRHSTRSTQEFKESLIENMLHLFPFLSRLKLMRQWGGQADITPDFSPIMGATQVEGYLVSAGWGTWGFKATPISGTTMAEMLASGKTPELIAPFSLDRFRDLSLIGERAAASVGH